MPNFFTLVTNRRISISRLVVTRLKASEASASVFCPKNSCMSSYLTPTFFRIFCFARVPSITPGRHRSGVVRSNNTPTSSRASSGITSTLKIFVKHPFSIEVTPTMRILLPPLRMLKLRPIYPPKFLLSDLEDIPDECVSPG